MHTPRIVSLVVSVLALGVGGCLDNTTGTQGENDRGMHADVIGDPPPSIRISEIHYDNASTDVGEAIEVSAPAGTDLTGWSLVLYNGSNGAVYNTSALSGTVANQCLGRGTAVVNYPANGIQNGPPDGVALVNGSTVIEFLSYEGSFTAVGGVANGLSSTDIGVSEPGSGPVGNSLSRTGGNLWSEGAATFGSCNPGENDTPLPPPPPPPPPPPLPATRFSEIHYDNTGTDVGEFLEVEGPAGTSLAGWRIELYNGSGGQVYGQRLLAGTIPDQCTGRGAVAFSFPTDGLQNGAPDGMALINASDEVVEFLSYEGALTANDGTAVGMPSQNIGASETSGTPIGQSLQRDALGVWSGPSASSYNSCNANGPVAPPSTIAFSGRTPFDAPLPVGFQDQLFATERSGVGDILATDFVWTSETPAVAAIDGDGVMTGLAAGTATFRATATDGTTSTWSLPIAVATPSATAIYVGNTEFGDPVDGTPGDDFILRRTEYTTSFNKLRGIPNWVSYDLDASHIVSGQDRCDCFTYDPSLPADFTRYTTADYTGGGAFLGLPAGETLDRGHLARSFDRTAGSLDNARTYYFSNIVPQYGAVNQGPWAKLENYLGGLAQTGTKEVYIIAGATGSEGTVKNEGLITIPAFTWKVAVIMNRDNGLADITGLGDFQVVAVIMPNASIDRTLPWQDFETTVDAVEALSGYDLLSLLRDDLETAAESGTSFPMAVTDGPYQGIVNLAIPMSAAASSDPDNQTLTFRWEFDDGSATSGVNASHAFATAGVHAVRLIVTDPLGLADTANTTATVVTAAAALDAPLATIAADVADGIMAAGPANSVRSKLQAAQASLGKGNTNAALGQLGAALNELDALVRSRRLTDAQAEAIAAVIRAVVESLGG